MTTRQWGIAVLFGAGLLGVAVAVWKAETAAAVGFCSLLLVLVLAQVLRTHQRLDQTQRAVERVASSLKVEGNSTRSKVASAADDIKKQSRTNVDRGTSKVRKEADERSKKDRIHHERLLAKDSRNLLGEAEGLIQLYMGMSPRFAMPGSGGWAMDPTGLVALLGEIGKKEPSQILELGSGASTVWMAYALSRIGKGQLLSIDHEPAFADQTRSAIERHDLAQWATVANAPLTGCSLEGFEGDWYSEDAFESVDEVDLLVVDGPPGATGRFARFPALPMLRSRLRCGSLIAVDDSLREDEREMLARWQTDYPELSVLEETRNKQLTMIIVE